MKKQQRQFRAGRPIRFSYHKGVEYYSHARPSKFVILAILASMLLMPGAYRATQFASAALARSDHVSAASASVPVSPPTDQPTNSTLPVQDERLSQKLKLKLATFPDAQKWSVYVQDITPGSPGRTAVINGDALYKPGALQNLFLLAPLEKKVVFDTWSIQVEGKTLTQCLVTLLRTNDQHCQQVVAGLVNVQYADTFNHELGFAKTKLADSSPQTTARETGELLVKLRRGQLLTDKARRQVFDALYGKKLLTSVSTGCKNCRVADVSSNENGFTHSAAIVTHGKYNYVLVIMSKGGMPDQITDLTRTVEAELYP